MSGCVLNRRFRCNARNTLLSAAGASWHTQGTRCQSSAGTCSVDQSHFFFLFLELKTGSGRPGINSLRTRLNPPSQTIRSKYVNPTSKITSLWNKLSLKKKTSTSHLKVPEDPAVSIFKSHPNPKIFSVSETKESRNSFGSGSSYLNVWKQYLFFSTKK